MARNYKSRPKSQVRFGLKTILTHGKYHIKPEETGDRPGKTVISGDVHGGSDRLWTGHRADRIGEDEGGIGGRKIGAVSGASRDG